MHVRSVQLGCNWISILGVPVVQCVWNLGIVGRCVMGKCSRGGMRPEASRAWPRAELGK